MMVGEEAANSLLKFHYLNMGGARKEEEEGGGDGGRWVGEGKEGGERGVGLVG